VKNHLPRTLQVSNRLLAMIEALPKKEERVFATSYANMLRRFVTMRKRTADTHKNPRLLAVDFTAFRTWAGTMIAYYTNGNVLTVKKLLGHKQIKNTMKYIGRIEFKNDDFETTSAATVEDILRLGKEGWIEYSVVKINNVEHHCFKKPRGLALMCRMLVVRIFERGKSNRKALPSISSLRLPHNIPFSFFRSFLIAKEFSR